MTSKVDEAVYGGKDEERRKHESFGQIRVSHVSGGAELYGSGFQHQHYITLEVVESEEIRNLSRTWHHGHRTIIEVAMSEAQFVELIARPNMGSGVPCTIQHRHTEGFKKMEGPPKQKNEAEHVSHEFQKTARRAAANLDVLERGLKTLLEGKGTPSKADLKKLQDALTAAKMAIGDSMPFVEKSFGEAMEVTTHKARVEMEAHASLLVTNLGLDVLSTARAIARGNGPSSPEAIEGPRSNGAA